jgi:hypothetical protein
MGTAARKMAMEPGARLDALVESVVLERPAGESTPPYSTVLLHARRALDTLLTKDYRFEVSSTGSGWRCNVFRAGFRRPGEDGKTSNEIRVTSVSGQTEAHAICLAALDLKLARWVGRGENGPTSSTRS